MAKFYWNLSQYTVKPRLEDFGYHFVVGRDGENIVTLLRDRKTGEKFIYDAFKGDNTKNQKRYEDLGEAVEEYVYEYLELKLKLDRISIPVNAGRNDPRGFFFMSKDAQKADKLMILINGSGAVRAGQWSRRLIINESFESGTMVPYIERATQEGYGVLIPNGNQNFDSNFRPIEGSESPEKHFVYVWNKFIKTAKARHIVIVAHSFGGSVVIDGVRNIPEATERIKAVAFTNSINFINKEKTSIILFIKNRARNWKCSTAPLDTPIRLDSGGENSRTCDQVSAGTTEHIWTSHLAKDSIFKYFKEKLTADHSRSKFIPTQVIPTQLEMISKMYRPEDLTSVYKMTSSPRGLAVIVNMENFEPDLAGEDVENNEDSEVDSLGNREGSEFDAKGLLGLFTALDFKTKLLVDLTKKDLSREIEKISKYDFSADDCFVLCIMSHGNRDFVSCCDGGKIEIKSITEMFNNKQCKTLCGKPKLFFIQACRGDSADGGTVVEDKATKISTKPYSKPDLEPDEGPATTSEHADILVAYSSVEGYSSFRDTHSGSWFIQSLIEVFREYACKEDVESMLTRVNFKVNSKGHLKNKQVPQPKTTLTKKVFFWPGMKFD